MQPSSSSFRFRPLFGSSVDSEEDEVEELKSENLNVNTCLGSAIKKIDPYPGPEHFLRFTDYFTNS